MRMSGEKVVCKAFEELSNYMKGIELTENRPYSLKISNPALAADLIGLSENKEHSKQARPYFHNSIVGSITGKTTNVPWAAPVKEYTEEYRDIYEEGLKVAFTHINSDNGNYKRRKFRDKRKDLIEQGVKERNLALINQKQKVSEQIAEILFKYYLRAKGYFVTNTYIPKEVSGPNYGHPDIVAWRSETTDYISEKLLNGDNASLHELGQLKLHKKSISNNSIADLNETVVIEVKNSDTGLRKARNQLYERGNNDGYLRSKCFDYGYAAAPLQDSSRKSAGMITFDKEGFSFEQDPVKYNEFGSEVDYKVRSEEDRKQALISELDNMALKLLLANLRFDQIAELANSADKSPSNVIKEINNSSKEEIVSKIMNKE